ncbi:MAG: hypothetical protein M3Y82_13725 [Verrucomicrobiota bacterium]|nr:hypothetical protein [Verrucomicrobiota bacterium]
MLGSGYNHLRLDNRFSFLYSRAITTPTLVLTLLTVIVSFLAPRAKANLILNGSFESPGFTNGNAGVGRQQYSALTGASTLLSTNLTPLAPVTNINWTRQTFSFVADSAVTRLSFKDTSVTDDNASFVDNVLLVDSSDLLASIHFSAVDICWPGRTNQMYQVQYRTNLSGTNWFNFGSPMLGTATNCVTDGINGMEQRFYRIIRVP